MHQKKRLALRWVRQTCSTGSAREQRIEVSRLCRGGGQHLPTRDLLHIALALDAVARRLAHERSARHLEELGGLGQELAKALRLEVLDSALVHREVGLAS